MYKFFDFFSDFPVEETYNILFQKKMFENVFQEDAFEWVVEKMPAEFELQFISPRVLIQYKDAILSA